MLLERLVGILAALAVAEPATSAPNAEAIASARQTLESILVRCGQNTYAEFQRTDAVNRLHRYFVEYTKFTQKIDELPVSAAEHLNGVEWKSTFVVSPSVFRDRLDGEDWSKYKDNAGLNNFAIIVTKKNGKINEFALSDDSYVTHPKCAEIVAPPPNTTEAPVLVPTPDPTTAALSQEARYLAIPAFRHPPLGEVWWGGAVPLRSSAQRDAAVKLVLASGTTLRIDEISGQWAKVTITKGNGAGTSGFMAVNALAMKAF